MLSTDKYRSSMNPAIEEFSIQLEHDIDEQYQYAPGEQLRGEVVLRLRHSIDLHSIQVRVCGQSSVSWEDGPGRQHQPKQSLVSHPEPTKRRFQSSEVYVDLKKDVFKAANGGTATLGPCEQRFQMEFPLPSTLPSSFIGKFGCVTYVVIATLRQSMHSTVTNLITSEPFVVTRRIRLTDHPEMLKPSEPYIRRRFRRKNPGRVLCCCRREKLEIRFRVERTGFLPGEDIMVSAAVVNGSSRVLDTFEAVLVMNSSFHAANSVRESVQVIARERHCCALQPRSSGEMAEVVRLSVPPHVPESSLDGCAIIDIAYRVHLLVDLYEGFRFETSFPITMVTVNDNQTTVENHRVKRNSSPYTVRFSTPTKENGTDWKYRKIAEPVNDEVKASLVQDPGCILDRFRHPMAPGETRENIIFADDSADEFYSTVL